MPLVLALAIVLVLCLVMLATTTAMLLALVGGIMTGVPFVAGSRRAQEKLFELCALDATSRFYDLGCGDGRFVAGMARHYPAAICTGVERAPLPAILLWLRTRLMPLSNMRAIYRSFTDVDLTDATHIYLYLFPGLMERLLPKLITELKPGSRVVSLDFPFKSRPASQTIVLGTGSHPSKLYVYDF